MNSDFYLTTAGESDALTEPRKCSFVNRVKGYNRDDYMLVKIDPTLSGQSFGLGGEDIEILILSTVFTGETLFTARKWPVAVYVGRVKDKSVLTNLTFEHGQVDLIAKGSLYQTFDEANLAASRKL